MTNVTLQLEDGLLDELQRRAKSKNVSLEEQILSVLQDAVIDRRRALLERMDAIAAMTPKGVPQTDSTLLIREDRDR
jgi:antitoxin FitA